MKEKKNKRLALAMACILTANILAACGSGTSQTPANDQTEQKTVQTEAAGQQTAAEQKTEAAAPAGEPEKLVIALKPEINVTDYDDNYLTKRLEEELNVDLVFILLPTDANERNTMLSLMATGQEADMPDVICAQLSSAQQDEFGMNGFLIPIQDYLNDSEVASYFNSVPREEDRKFMLSELTEPDGNIYGLPRYTPSIFDVNETRCRYYINQTWLDKLGLSVPKTTDELYNVLKAFAAEDPNGNGVHDEIPIYGLFDGVSGGTDIVMTLMNAFLFAPKWGNLVLDEDGTTVIAPYVQDEWREGLEYLHRLCAEGLMPESVFTDDAAQYYAILGNMDANLVGVTVASTETVAWRGNMDNTLDMAIMEPVAGPEGACYTPYIPTLPTANWFVTAACKNPELAVKVGDYFYNEEMSISARYGEPGVNWTDDPEVLNDPSYSNSLIASGLWTERRVAEIEPAWEQQTNALWGQSNPMYRDPELFAGVVKPWEDSGDAVTVSPLDRDYWNYVYYVNKVPKERYISKIGYTLDEQDELDAETSEVAGYVMKSAAQFITGERTLDDAGWDAYKADLEKIGFSKLMEIAQRAWDRDNK